MQSLQVEFQPRPREIVVMVVDQNDEIRSALADVLEDDGYAVIEADTLSEASAIIDAAATPMVLVIGNAGMGTDDGVDCFTAVAANTATHQAYVYMTSTPPRRRLPALVYGLAPVGAPPPPRSFELVSLLATVAAAAARVRAG
jgi:response regulator RpfG family c-di-GMP phosphodiesterase